MKRNHERRLHHQQSARRAILIDVANEGAGLTPPLKIAIIGTSNSLARTGYVPALQRRLGTRIANFSVGASGSVHSIHSAAGVDFSAFDVCIVDFAVNEEVQFKSGIANPLLVSGILRHLVCRCFAGRCLPVFLILPRRTTDAAGAVARAFYRAVAKEFGCPVLDGYRLLEDLVRLGLPQELAFSDPAHMTLEASDIVAELLGAFCLDEARGIGWEPKALDGADYRDFSLRALVGDGLALASRRNSRFTGDFVQVPSPQTLTVSVPEGSSAVGIRLNLAKTSAYLSIEGRDRMLVDCRNLAFVSSSKEFVSAVLPLPQAVRERDGVIRIVVSAAPDRDGTEPGHVFINRRLKFPASGAAEIASLVLALSDRVSAASAPADGAHVDIYDRLGHQAELRLTQIKDRLSSEEIGAIVTRFRDTVTRNRKHKQERKLVASGSS